MVNIDQKSWTNVRLAMRKAVGRWIYDPNVMFIDFGWRERGGTLLDKEPPCIRVHVIEKIPEQALEVATQKGMTRGKIEKTIAGFPVDVPQGAYQLYWRRRGWGGGWRQPANPRTGRLSPMQGGISISDAFRSIAGTLGGSVIDRETGDRMILSNFHVLAGRWYARPGWPIYQPGRGDGGSRADTVARFSRHAMASNLDAAVAELTGSRQLINDQFDLAPVRGVGWAQVGMEVIKSGRTTDVTRGRVAGVEGTARMPYSGVYHLIQNVMTIEPRLGPDVSLGGDSGSFWLDEETMNVVGLHFARGKRHENGLAIDIQPILDALNVDIVV
jgi:endonuclease G